MESRCSIYGRCRLHTHPYLPSIPPLGNDEVSSGSVHCARLTMTTHLSPYLPHIFLNANFLILHTIVELKDRGHTLRSQMSILLVNSNLEGRKTSLYKSCPNMSIIERFHCSTVPCIRLAL